MSGLRLVLAVALAVGTTSCATMSVKVDADPDVDVGVFETWVWNAPPPPTAGTNPFADNPLLRKRVRQAATAALAGRGYREVADAADADFGVTFHVVLTSKHVVWGSAGWAWPYWSAPGTFNESTVEEGTLVLDLTSPDGRQLFWRGWVSGAVPTADSDRDRVAEGVQSILAELPAHTRRQPTRGGSAGTGS